VKRLLQSVGAPRRCAAGVRVMTGQSVSPLMPAADAIQGDRLD
jgi:hypothetical protein